MIWYIVVIIIIIIVVVVVVVVAVVVDLYSKQASNLIRQNNEKI